MKHSTPLVRRTALVRRPSAAARSGSPSRARRMGTGPDRATRELVKTRAGRRCERCGVHDTVTACEVHHRRPRGMGGSRNDALINLVSSLVYLCGQRCHRGPDGVKSRRLVGISGGWIVPRPLDPALTPIAHHSRGLVLLTADGGYSPFEVPRG